MEARPTLRRVLSLAAIGAAVASLSACGGGTSAGAAGTDPPLATYASSRLSFTHPAAWKSHPYSWHNNVVHFNPWVYLSTQPLQNPCTTDGNETSCGFPVKRLEPGGVLVVWEQPGIPNPGAALIPGKQLRVSGARASRKETAGGKCSSIGADRTIEVEIEQASQIVPVFFTACLRGPGLAQSEKSIDALLASAKLS